MLNKIILYKFIKSSAIESWDETFLESNASSILGTLKGLLDKFQYCDSNIGLFSISPPLVIALPTMR